MIAKFMITEKLNIPYHGHPLQIEYFIRPGQKETILYLHGLGCSKVDFANATEIESLKDQTIIGFDFAGHGGSNYTKNLNMDDLVEITNLFIEQLDLKNIILVGHSMGGLVGLLFAQKYGSKIKAFINIEGNLNADDCFFSREVIKHSYEEFIKHGFDKIKQTVKAKRNNGFQTYAKHLEKVAAPAYYDYCPSMTEYSTHENLVEKFIALKMPRLFIYGSENNHLVYLNQLRDSGIEIAEIPNSNHWTQYDNPEKFYRVIANFLNKNNLASDSPLEKTAEI